MSMARPLVDRLAFPVRVDDPPTSQLQLVSSPPRRRRRPKAFFATVTVLTIFGIIVAQILLSISLQSGAYEISGLQHQVKDLGRTYESSTQDINTVNSPQNISESAESLGMVGKSNPIYLRLSDSLVTGSAEAASANGSLISGGDLVPNSMLAARRAQRQIAAALVAASAHTQTTTDAARSPGTQTESGNSAPPSASVSASISSGVPSKQGIPSPSTH
jgi:cell division protein FtsL